MRDWSIQRKSLAAFGAALAVLIAVVVVSYLTTNAFVRSTSSVSHSFEVIAIQERIYSDLIDVMWNQRVYLVTGNPDDLAARTSARDRLIAQSALLPTMPFASLDEQRQRIATLQTARVHGRTLVTRRLTPR